MRYSLPKEKHSIQILTHSDLRLKEYIRKRAKHMEDIKIARNILKDINVSLSDLIVEERKNNL